MIFIVDRAFNEAAELLLSLAEQDPDGVRLTARQVAEIERRLREPSDSAPHEDVRTYFQRTAG